MRACYQAAGFIDRRVFCEARKQANRMHVGDPLANLAALQASKTPLRKGTTLWKAQLLMRIGWPPHQLVEAFALRSEAPWSTLHYEQLHGAGAAQHKRHQEMGAESHSAKTNVQVLLPMVRATKKSRRTKLEIKLAALEKRKPAKANACGVFLKASMKRALAGLPCSSSARRKSVAQQVVSTHHKAFAKLPPKVQKQNMKSRQASTDI